MSNLKKSKYHKGITLFLLCCFLFSLTGCSEQAHDVQFRNSLIELSCNGMSFSVEEKKSINALLKACYYEDSEECGFVFSDNNSVNLYTAVNLLKMGKLFNDESIINELRQRLSFLSTISVEKLGVLNLIYYVKICDTLGFSYQKDEVKKALLQYYDSNAGMFFVFGEDDAYGIKYTVSKMCVEDCGDLISDIKADMQLYARQALETFPFSTDASMTLYNAGGSILTYCAALGVDCSSKKTELIDWIQYWDQFYASCDTSEINGALQYSDFLEVKDLFQTSFPDEKLNGFYQSATAKDIKNVEDIQMLYNVLKHTNPLNDTERNQWIENKIQDTMSEGMFNKSISPRITAYALALASWTGFSFNHEKANAYIEKQYDLIHSIEDNSEKADALYYLIGADQIVNNYYSCIYKEDEVQNYIDDILGHLSGKTESIASEAEAVRKIVEIVSDLQIFQIDVKIKEKYIPKIKKTINSVLENDQLSHSISVVDVKWVNDCLGLSLVDESIVNDAYASLKTEHGVKSIALEEIEPDVYSTFMFLKLAETDFWDESAESFTKYSTSFTMDAFANKVDSGGDVSIAEAYYTCYLNCVKQSDASE